LKTPAATSRRLAHCLRILGAFFGARLRQNKPFYLCCGQ